MTQLIACRLLRFVACISTVLLVCFYMLILEHGYQHGNYTIQETIQEWDNSNTPYLSDIHRKRDAKIHFRTYGNEKYAGSKQRITKEANQTNWFASVLALGPADLPIWFTQRYGKILKQSRGAGYWIWKFWLIESALDEMQTGDFLLYLDAGCKLNAAGEPRFREYLAMLSTSPFDILTFTMNNLEHTYTTERVFRAFGVEAANEIIRESGQYVATVLLLRKGDHLRCWLSIIWKVLEADPWIITDKYNDEARRLDPEFIDARHDQSISSVSRKLARSLVLGDETYPPGQEKYPFWASRLRN